MRAKLLSSELARRSRHAAAASTCGSRKANPRQLVLRKCSCAVCSRCCKASAVGRAAVLCAEAVRARMPSYRFVASNSCSAHLRLSMHKRGTDCANGAHANTPEKHASSRPPAMQRTGIHIAGWNVHAGVGTSGSSRHLLPDCMAEKPQYLRSKSTTPHAHICTCRKRDQTRHNQSLTHPIANELNVTSPGQL